MFFLIIIYFETKKYDEFQFIFWVSALLLSYDPGGQFRADRIDYNNITTNKGYWSSSFFAILFSCSKILLQFTQ